MTLSKNKLIKIDTLITLLKENPQEQVSDILKGNILLNQDGYNIGVLSLTAIVSGGSETIEDSFLMNAESISQSCNTLILFSDYPFDLLINTGPLHKDVYSFTLISDAYFTAAVANRSEENTVKVRYLLSASKQLGSSYVYT
jgi:hypothetical protein